MRQAARLRDPVDRPDAAANDRMRRADWRFLLPCPTPARTVSFARGRLDDAVAAVSESVVRPRDAVDGSCDLAVLANPNESTLRDALRLLRDGGALYTEWTGWAGMSPHRVQRALESAGAFDAHAYWPWPWPGLYPPKFWMPASSAGARRYLGGAEAPARPPVLHSGGRLLEAARGAARTLGVLYPLCAVGSKPSETRGPTAGSTPGLAGLPMPTAIRDAIATHTHGMADADPAEQAAWLLLTTGPRAVSKVVGVLLAGRTPIVAVKLARIPEAEGGLRREADALRRLGERVPAAAGAAPEVLFCVNAGGTFAVGETALVGRPAWHGLSPARARALALRVTDWLSELVETDTARQPRESGNGIIVRVVDQFSAMFGAVADPALLARSRAALQDLPALPRTFEHRDMGPWNLMLDRRDGRLLVLDWESAEPDGLPALDLFYFLTHLDFFVAGTIGSPRAIRTYQQASRPDSGAARLRRECVSRYAARIGLDARVLEPLRTLAWMVHARSDFQHLVSDHGEPPPEAALHESLFFRMWAEDARSLPATEARS